MTESVQGPERLATLPTDEQCAKVLGGCEWSHGQVLPCEAHQQYGASPLDEDRIPLPEVSE